MESKGEAREPQELVHISQVQLIQHRSAVYLFGEFISRYGMFEVNVKSPDLRPDRQRNLQ